MGANRETLFFAQRLATWLHERTLAVYHDLERHQTTDGQPEPESIAQPDWKTVSRIMRTC